MRVSVRFTHVSLDGGYKLYYRNIEYPAIPTDLRNIRFGQVFPVTAVVYDEPNNCFEAHIRSSSSILDDEARAEEARRLVEYFGFVERPGSTP